MAEGTPRFGEQPLPQTVAAAGAVCVGWPDCCCRWNTSIPTVDAMLAQIRRVGAGTGCGDAPPDPTPRDRAGQHRGPAGVSGPRLRCRRVQPVLSRVHVRPSRRRHRVRPRHVSRSFTKGPPGLVNGGFLAVFFDCVTQHQSCASGRTGKTRSLTVTFRRPTPILTELGFDVVRSEADGRVTSTARLLFGDEVLCIGEFSTAASSPDKLSVFDFGQRRVNSR